MKRLIPLALAGAVSMLATAAQASFFAVYETQAQFDAATNTTVAEDFEGVAAGSLNTPLASFSRNGITYTGLAGTPFGNVFIAGSPVDYPNFGADVPFVGSSQLTSHVLTANGDEDIQATFAAPHFALGFDTYYNGLGLLTVSLLDATNTAFATFTVSDGTDPNTGLADLGYLGFLTDTPIWGFRFTSTHGAQLNTGFDNIAVGSAATPEPAEWTLMIAGFGLSGAMLRRRRRTAPA